MNNHIFEIHAEWTGNLSGHGKFQTHSLSELVSIPKEMGGQGVGTNPEDLLLAASATCFLITLIAILQANNIPYEKINLNSKAFFEFVRGPVIKQIEHHSCVTLKRTDNFALIEQKIQHCVLEAKQNCMVSLAMKGNVEMLASVTVAASH